MSTSLSKQDLQEGYIVWLRQDADTINPTAFQRANIRKEALDHPVLIVNLLSEENDYVWICFCSGSARETNLPIAYNTDAYLEPCPECKNPHGFACHRYSQHFEWLGLPTTFMTAAIRYNNNVLYHKDPNASMCKPTHVHTRRNYEVPVGFLRPLGERFQSGEIGSHRLDYVSMHLAKEKTAAAMRKMRETSYALRQWEQQEGVKVEGMVLWRSMVVLFRGWWRKLWDGSRIRRRQGRVE